MKIISLEAENVKRLKAVSIKPDGSLVVVGGENGNGKSSVLDSIQYALGGQKLIPDKPVRDGQKNAKVVLDLGKIVVTRTFTKKGTNLVVKNKDGASFTSPQSMLEELVGNLSFDPMEFSRMDSKRQLQTLKKVLGLDFDELDKEYKKVFDERTNINRNGKELKSQLDGIKFYEDVPTEEISIAELSKQLSDGINSNQELNKNVSYLNNCKNRFDEIESEIKKLQLEKKSLANKIKELNKQVSEDKEIDTTSIEARINSAETINNKIRSNTQRKQLEEQVSLLRSKSLKMTSKLKEIEQQKINTLEQAKFPIHGLTFTEDSVMFNNIPFDQCSSAEKIKISVCMGLAMNPKLKILLIRDGSFLDTNNLELVAKLATKHDAQVWVERVGKGKECSIIIEDGQISY